MKSYLMATLSGIFLLSGLWSTGRAQVIQDWLAVYDGPSGSIDSVRNLAVDELGNVYVTGSSTSSTLLDYTTLKYNSSGLLQWEARYDGSGHFRDDAQWLALDNSGNVYVTGSSRSSVQAGSEGFLTVKYNADGAQQWAARYDGPGNSTDVAAKVAVDNSGNVYVTGYSYGIMTDYATIKYNADGVQQWVARYNGPGNSLDASNALAVDESGNVFVTGWSRSTSLYGSEDYLTIKYNSSGVEEWVARYNGPSNMIDQAASLAIDNLGNVYVTGYSLSPTTQSDYVTIKYNSDGAQQWTASYNNSAFNGSDIARMVIVDNSGNVYVTGTANTEYPLGYPNYATIKYNSSGVQLWVSGYNGPGNAEDRPYSLALDDLGNVYVTGKTTIPGFVYDFATVKYNSSGTQLWEERFDGASGLHDGATWVDVDDAGNVYVAGNSMYMTDFASDFVIIRYSQFDPVGQPPVVSDIPNQTAVAGRFAPIRVDNYVTDPDDPDSDIIWTWSGNSGLRVTWDAVRRRIVVRPTRNWTGNETITFTATDPDGLSDSDPATFTVSSLVSSAAFDRTTAEDEVPSETLLDGNYPNPFNPTTIIRYGLAQSSHVSLVVYDVLGQQVAVLADGLQEEGYHEAIFDARGLPSGVYFCRLNAADKIEFRKLVLSK